MKDKKLKPMREWLEWQPINLQTILIWTVISVGLAVYLWGWPF